MIPGRDFRTLHALVLLCCARHLVAVWKSTVCQILPAFDVLPARVVCSVSGNHVDIALLGPDAPEDEVRRHRSRPVTGLRPLVHGHFVVDEVERIADRWNIDTGATFAGRDRLTLLHVNARRIRSWTFDVDESS